MTDIRIRKNEKCVIGLPACDYVFSSTRSCFIAYGFRSSSLEMEILRNLLEIRGIEAVEAGTRVDPGKYAFCTKICSKIITSQFCVVLMNHDLLERENKSIEIPNENVAMEYGLMLGHNKYVIPLQLESQQLPFNVAGLDTIKYNTKNFRSLAEKAIDQAVSETSQKETAQSLDQSVAAFLLTQNATIVNIQNSSDDRIIYQLGSPFGFNLLVKFDGLSYIFFGNFTALRVETTLWRVAKLAELLSARLTSVDIRKSIGLAGDAGLAVLAEFSKRLELWILVNSEAERKPVEEWLKGRSLPFHATVFDLPQALRDASQIP